jgi:hypothetical protein
MLEKKVHQKAVITQTQSARRRFSLRPPGVEPVRTSKQSSDPATVIRGMDSQYQIVSTPEALRLACEHLEHSEAAGLDCETTDLDPHLGRLRLIQLSSYPIRLPRMLLTSISSTVMISVR